jgi:hypothetical protein
LVNGEKTKDRLSIEKITLGRPHQQKRTTLPPSAGALT